jgi:hypothetical protein
MSTTARPCRMTKNSTFQLSGTEWRLFRTARPVSSRSAKQPGWRSPPIVTISIEWRVRKDHINNGRSQGWKSQGWPYLATKENKDSTFQVSGTERRIRKDHINNGRSQGWRSQGWKSQGWPYLATKENKDSTFQVSGTERRIRKDHINNGSHKGEQWLHLSSSGTEQRIRKEHSNSGHKRSK